MKAFFTIAVLVSVCMFPYISNSQSSDFTTSQLSLLNLADENGKVPVIINFDIPFQPVSKQNTAVLNQQRSTIAFTAENILERNRSYYFENVQLYRNVPHMAVVTNREGLKSLFADPDVKSVSVNGYSVPQMDYSNQLIGSPEIWGLGYTGEGTVIAVMDTGVEKEHDHFGDRVVAEACFSSELNVYANSLCPGGTPVEIGEGTADDCDPDQSYDCGHGTHVAGIASGSGVHNGDQLRGVAKDADIIAVQVFVLFDHTHNTNPCGFGALRDCAVSYFSDQLAALDWLYDQSEFFNLVSVNISIGGGQYDSICDDQYLGLKNAMDLLKSENVATIVASGNDGYNDALSAPACISTAISVGSTDTDKYMPYNEDDFSNFTNLADFLDILAPGRVIVSSVPDNEYFLNAGTSMAAPHVAGAWALYRQAFPDASVDEVLDAFTEHAEMLTEVWLGITKPRLQVDASMLNTITNVDIPGSNQGWRQLGSPNQNTTYHNMLSNIWTQGFTGADSEDGTSNVYTYEENRRMFRPVVDSEHIIGNVSTTGESAGKSILVYVFEDDNFNGSPDLWPKTLNVAGVPNIGDVSLNLSRTDTPPDGMEGWHMVSNPYPFTLDWSEILADANDIHAQAYVWDANHPGGADYIHTGDEWDGMIAPFQGFWVRALDNPGELTFKAEHAAGSVSELYLEEDQTQVQINISGEEKSSHITFRIDDQKAENPEMYNAVRLSSLVPDYLHIYSTALHSHEKLVLQYLAYDELPGSEKPLYIESTLSGEFTIGVDVQNVPDGIDILFRDRKANSTIPVDEEFEYTFSMESGSDKNRESITPLEWVKESIMPSTKINESAKNRFSLIFSGTATNTEDDTSLPVSYKLSQNYPNPFNPITQIRYALPEPGDVRLEVYNIVGQRVATLVNTTQNAGYHDTTFDATRLSSGVYIYRLTAGNFVQTRKMLLVK